MTVNAATLTSAADKGTDGAVTLTITPPAAGDYDHCEIRYMLATDSAWSSATDYTGAQGVSGTHDVSSLTNGGFYSFLVYAVDASGNGGEPSTIKGAVPSTGTSAILLERIMAYAEALVKTITTGGGYWGTISEVYRFGEMPQTEDLTFPIAFLRAGTVSVESEVLYGAIGASTKHLPLAVVIKSRRPEGQADDWIPKEAIRQLGALTAAMLADRQWGNLIRWIEPESEAPNIESEEDDGALYALCVSKFIVSYRHQFANASVSVP